MTVSDITQLLSQIAAGDAASSDELLPLVYEELKKLARRRMADEKPGQTLQATALVHEAYLRLVGNSSGDPTRTGDVASQGSVWRDRAHFFGAAAQAMRRILIENARRKVAVKHGGNRSRETLTEVAAAEALPPLALLALDEALERLARSHPTHAKLVELQFYAGLEQRDAADCLNISVRTARRYWFFARAWLFEQLADGDIAFEAPSSKRGDPQN